jgi:aldehyde dehydrogenase family 7 protein A1
VYDQFVSRIQKVYETIRIGDPFDSNTLCGPLHTKSAIREYEEGLETIKKQVFYILIKGW